MIATATATATEPRADEGSLAPSAPIVARIGVISSPYPFILLRLRDFHFLISDLSSLPGPGMILSDLILLDWPQVIYYIHHVLLFLFVRMYLVEQLYVSLYTYPGNLMLLASPI